MPVAVELEIVRAPAHLGVPRRCATTPPFTLRTLIHCRAGVLIPAHEQALVAQEQVGHGIVVAAKSVAKEMIDVHDFGGCGRRGVQDVSELGVRQYIRGC